MGRGWCGLPRALPQGGDHVHVHGISWGARLLATIHDSQLLHGGGQGADELFDGEGPVEAHFEDADLLALLHGPLDILMGNVAAGTHDDDHTLGLWVPEVFIEAVLASRQGAEAIHLLLHDGREGLVVGRAGFAAWKKVSGFWAVPRMTG